MYIHTTKYSGCFLFLPVKTYIFSLYIFSYVYSHSHLILDCLPDSNIVLAQIRSTSGPCGIHAGQMWAGSELTLLAVWVRFESFTNADAGTIRALRFCLNIRSENSELFNVWRRSRSRPRRAFQHILLGF